MNPLFTWIATRTTMLSSTIYYPDFSGKLTGGQPFSAGYVAFKQAYNDGVSADHQAIDFYTAFRNYLRISRPLFSGIRIIAGELAKFLYYLANALLSFFVDMFKLFNIAGTPFNDSDYGTIAKVFHDGIWFGVVIMVLVATFYVTGEIIGGASWSRNKNILRNIILILFILFGLPASTSLMSKGALDVAHDAFGNRVSRNSGGSRSIGTEISSLFQNNVYSVPLRVEQMKPGTPFDTGTSGLFHEHTHSYYDVNTTPLVIRLQDMKQSNRNKYNGLGTNNHPTSISTFLSDYGHDQILNPDELNDITTSARDTASKEKSMLGKAKNQATNDLNSLPLVGSFLANHDQGPISSDYTNLFSYYIANDGIAGGGGPTKEEHELKKFKYSHWTSMLNQAYTLYYVNWFAIYSGLLMMILVTATYLYKLFKLFYKLVIMYASSGPLLARNVDDYSRIKSWTRDLFSIYEMLIMMVVMFYLFFVVYNIINGAIDAGIDDARTGFLANPFVEACVDLIADLGLFRISIGGIRSIDTMIGSQGGGGANTGATGVVGGMLALRAGSAGLHMLGNTGVGDGIKGVGHAIGHPIKTSKSFKHGINNHLKNHRKNKQKADTNGRKNGGNHKPGSKPNNNHTGRTSPGSTHDTNTSENGDGTPSDNSGSGEDTTENNSGDSTNTVNSNGGNRSNSKSNSQNRSHSTNTRGGSHNSHNGGGSHTTNQGGSSHNTNNGHNESHESNNNSNNNSSESHESNNNTGSPENKGGDKNNNGGNGSKTIIGGGSHYDGQNNNGKNESDNKGGGSKSNHTDINNHNDYGHNQKNVKHSRNDHRASNNISFKHNNNQTNNHSHTSNNSHKTDNNVSHMSNTHTSNNHTSNNHKTDNHISHKTDNHSDVKK